MIRVGIIGCGSVASSHANAINEFSSRASLVGVSDVSPERLKIFAEKYGARAYDHAEGLLAQSDIDCVLISLPHDLHVRMAIEAAKAGKHILLEKPIALTLRECDEIMEAVAANNVTLSVGQSYRYFDGPWHAKQILDQKVVGIMVFAIATFSKNWSIANRKKWQLDRNRGGGHWISNGVHTVNTLQWLTGSPVVAVKGISGQYFHPKDRYPQMRADDATLAMLQHENGVYTIAVVTGYRRGAPKDMLEITCNNGKIKCDRKRLWVGVDEQWKEKSLTSVSDKVREWDAFLTCLETKSDPPVPGAEARETVRVLLAVEESAKTGREIRLEER